MSYISAQDQTSGIRAAANQLQAAADLFTSKLDLPRSKHNEPIHVAISFPGGGTRCSAQIGKLYYLSAIARKYPMKIVAVAGTSGGALNAGAFLSGYHQGGFAAGINRLIDLWENVEQTAQQNQWAMQLGQFMHPIQRRWMLAAHEALSTYSPQNHVLHQLIEPHIDMAVLRDGAQAVPLYVNISPRSTGHSITIRARCLEDIAASGAHDACFPFVQTPLHGPAYDGICGKNSVNGPVRELGDHLATAEHGAMLIRLDVFHEHDKWHLRPEDCHKKLEAPTAAIVDLRKRLPWLDVVHFAPTPDRNMPKDVFTYERGLFSRLALSSFAAAVNAHPNNIPHFMAAHRKAQRRVLEPA